MRRGLGEQKTKRKGKNWKLSDMEMERGTKTDKSN